MDADQRRLKPALGYRTFDPEYDVVASASIIVAKVVVQAEFRDYAPHQERNRLIWPTDEGPPLWWNSLIVEEDAHTSA